MTVEFQSESKPLLKTLVFSLLAIIAGFVLSQMWLSNKDNQDVVSSAISTSHVELCNLGIRLPGKDCEFIHESNTDDERSISEQIASLPDLSSSLSYFEWLDGGESDAVKYLVLIQSIIDGRRHQHMLNNEALDEQRSLLEPIWKEYPELVAASSCTYCRNHSKVMEGLLKSIPSVSEKQLTNIALDVTFFGTILNQELISTEIINRFLPLHAGLSSAGDSGTARAIGGALVKQEKWADLQPWVDNGLNGGRSLDGIDLEKLPREIVVTAWQQGVSLGYDNIELTEHLVASGHRPALRWLIWLLSTDYKYLHGYAYRRLQSQYAQMLNKYSNFAPFQGEGLATFYNQNWKKIKWDSKFGRWDYQRPSD